MQIRVVSIFRLGKAQVVGGHHSIALRSINRRQQLSLTIRRVGQGSKFLHIGPLGIGDQPGRCRAIDPRGQQQYARRIGFFTTHANGLVVERDDFDVTFGCARQGSQWACVKSGCWQRHKHRRSINECTTVQRRCQRSASDRALAQIVLLLASHGELGCQVVKHLVIGIANLERPGQDVTGWRSACQRIDFCFDVDLGGAQSRQNDCALGRIETGEGRGSI